MIRKSTYAIGLILMLSSSWPALAQTALGTLRGVVLDQQGGVLPGVTISIRQIDTNTLQATQSADGGRYFLPNLRPGQYEVIAELSGFAATKEQLELLFGQDPTVNFTMKVCVLAALPIAAPRSVSSGTHMT